MSLLKGSEILVRALEECGVDTVFAYPGGTAIEHHQALVKSKKIRVILPRHEQGGAFAAGGYARATGKAGVCMATSGPGATNLVSGIADAYMDSIPLVTITGQVPSAMIGKNFFQEVDMIGMTRMIVKHSYLVLKAADIPRVVKEAFHLAVSGRPGPVVIDIPKNVQIEQIEADFEPEMKLTSYSVPGAPAEDEVEALRKMIAASSRPCLYLGGGIISAGAAEEAKKFAENYNIPAVTSLMGIGALPVEHPLNLHLFGMHGSYAANCAANESDLLLCFGARFSDRSTGSTQCFARGAKIVHVDIDASEINKNIPADLGIVCDIKAMLTALNSAPVRQDYKAWFEKINTWKNEHPLDFVRKNHFIQPQFAVSELSRLTNGEAVIVPGVGQHQIWAAQYYKYKSPRQFLTSGGLGAMGFGLPAAMGAKTACPEKLVINIDGDGSFQMNIQELGTLYAENIDLKMMILNNQVLGMVAQWEDRFYNHVRGNTILSCDKFNRPYPDFVTIAKGYGINAMEVFEVSELEKAIKTMLETPGPFLLDVHTPYEEHVLPMIPPGKDYKAIITA